MNTAALLERIRDGDRDAEAQLLSRVYEELRRVANGYMRRERRNHPVRATELLHEVLIRIHPRLPALRDGNHLRAIVRRSMHTWLIDWGRRRTVRERKEPLLFVNTARVDDPTNLLDLALGLEALGEIDPRASDVVQCRVYQGLSIDETAACLSVSHGTVERDYRRGRAWLYRWLQEDR